VPLRPKRLLFLAHRWLGVVMCLFFAIWFATGIVMMYVEYPELTEDERLDMLPALDPDAIGVTAAAAVERVRQRCPTESLTLSAVGFRPAFHVVSRCGERATLFADDGTPVAAIDRADLALATVAASGFAAPAGAMRYTGAVDMDQWTVSEALSPHRPLHRVEVGDVAGTMLYISDTSGQIVRDTNAAERLWNWIGSTLHWIYPFQLRRHRPVWVNLIICLSLVGLVSVATGAVIGIMRIRPRRGYGKRGASPYRGMMRWHHLLGLVFLLFVSTFMFSGLMSMSPWGLFSPAEPAAPQIDRYTGGPLERLDEFPDLAEILGEGGIKEIEWRQIAGRGHLVLRRSADRRKAIVAGPGAESGRTHVLSERIDRAIQEFLPDASIVESEVLVEHDDYYYSRHNRYRPLPALRVAFDDPAATWFYVDIATGAVVQRHTRETRLGRWLYNGLHSLDFVALTRLGPGWDATVIALSVAGFAFAVTSVVLGWRRLRMT
jgi:uncharacterized iron-regulated membrane protein